MTSFSSFRPSIKNFIAVSVIHGAQAGDMNVLFIIESGARNDLSSNCD
jgi:hypothetical protein